MDPLTVPPRTMQSDDSSFERGEGHAPPPPRTRGPQESFVVEIFKFAILALVIVVPFRLFVAQPFIVSGASMAPTFETGQYLIIDQVTYRLEQPKRGDVVIFRYPNDPDKFFIKRIIGLPGETVSLKGGVVEIRDSRSGESTRLEEPYISMPTIDDVLTITLSSNEYFVMGDNRPASSDSRVWGPVPRSNIVGKAFARLLPLPLIGLHPGEYHVYSENGTSGE